MDKATIARRLSGALGRKITVDDLSYVGAGDAPSVVLKSGEVVGLRKGNVAYLPGADRGWYVRNGRRISAGEVYS